MVRRENRTPDPAAADHGEAVDKLQLELRRGAIVLACLSQLGEASYGYELQQRLAARGMEIEQGTLYPLLRRLEDQGLLEEEWRVEESRPRKYYRRTAAGTRALETLRANWDDMVAVMSGFLDGNGE